MRKFRGRIASERALIGDSGRGGERSDAVAGSGQVTQPGSLRIARVVFWRDLSQTRSAPVFADREPTPAFGQQTVREIILTLSLNGGEDTKARVMSMIGVTDTGRTRRMAPGQCAGPSLAPGPVPGHRCGGSVPWSETCRNL
ncbi:MAG: hypothetical protein AAF317_13545 [Pseudomonadota bacterium]